MKKLMTVIAAVTAAFGLYADDYFSASTVDFKDLTAGDAYTFPADPGSLEMHWYNPGGAEGTITEGTPNFLALEADAPVYRAASIVELTPEQVAIAAEADEDLGTEARGGIIFDQKVKFSAFDTDTVVPEGLDAEGAKIAVWVKTIQEEASEDPAINHLMITAGNLDIMLTPDKDTPFVTKELTTENIDVNKFYQLTITAIEAGTVGGKVIPGFKVALDGEDIALAEGLFPADPSVGGGTYSAEGADLIKVNKLFPSLVKYSLDNAGTLQGVAFKGTGAVESIDISQKGLYNIEVAITAPAGAKIVKVNDEDYTGGKVSITPGSDVKVELAADGAYVVKKPVQTIEGVNGDITADQFEDGTVVEALAQIGDVYYETLPEAVAAADGTADVKLIKSCTIAEWIIVNKAVTIDFGEFTLTPAEGFSKDALLCVNHGGDVTLKGTTGGIDSATKMCAIKFTSTSEDKIKIAEAVDANAAKLTIVGGVYSGYNYGISGNGTLYYENGSALPSTGADYSAAYWTRGNCKLVVSGGTIKAVANDGVAIYQPQACVTTISAGTITGEAFGIYAKSGSVSVSGGEISSTATAFVDPTVNNNGANGSGVAMVVETGSEQGAYANNLTFSVTGGKFTSVGAAVVNFVRTGAEPIVPGISGGLFKATPDVALIVPVEGKIAKWVDDADGYVKPAYDEEIKTYTVWFSTNTVTVAEKTLTDVESGTVLEAKQIPDFGEGTWDVEPLGAIITCDTNFNFTVKAEENWDVDPEDEDKPASEVWTKVPENLADVPAGKLSTWAKANNVPFGGEFTETMEEAYLLDCAPDKVAEEKAKINIASIEFKDGEWVITTVSGDEADDVFGNGKLELVDVTKDVTGAEGSDAAKLWKMKLVPITATKE